MKYIVISCLMIVVGIVGFYFSLYLDSDFVLGQFIIILGIVISGFIAGWGISRLLNYKKFKLKQKNQKEKN